MCEMEWQWHQMASRVEGISFSRRKGSSMRNDSSSQRMIISKENGVVLASITSLQKEIPGRLICNWTFTFCWEQMNSRRAISSPTILIFRTRLLASAEPALVFVRSFTKTGKNQVIGNFVFTLLGLASFLGNFTAWSRSVSFMRCSCFSLTLLWLQSPSSSFPTRDGTSRKVKVPAGHYLVFCWKRFLKKRDLAGNVD